MSAEETGSSLAVAVVGMSGRFPGARDLDQLWRNLRDGVESITFFSDEELERPDGAAAPYLADPAFVRAAPVLDDVELFDAPFFGFSAREAELTDPQQRIFLEICWEALEDAGVDPARASRVIGVYAGAGFGTYLLNNVAGSPAFLRSPERHEVIVANDKDFLATRIAYKLDLRGPAVTVQCACSTSLAAVQMACQSILAYQCDMALAGGVTVMVPARTGYLPLEGGVMSPDGHCRAFDAAARGTVFGSGAGVVLLKRLDDALADGDPIRAVILGAAMNNDGAGKVGFVAPGVAGQAEVIETALSLAGVAPETVGYVEAHGTGTPLGDPVEIAALNRVFGPASRGPATCPIGTIKTNVGHLDAASGVAGLIKTVLALEHRQIPPSLHFERPNPHVDFGGGPFYVNTRLAAWEPLDGLPRRAGVSSFGMGGTNVHAVLEEAPPAPPGIPSRPVHLLLLSARTPAALDAATDRLAARLAGDPDLDLADAAYTLQVGRRAFDHRRIAVVASREEAAAALAGRDPRRVESGARESPVERPVFFLFPGQGAQRAGMGAGLYREEPVFRREMDRCAEILRPFLEADLRDLLFAADGERLRDTALAQPALFAVEHSLARVWMEWGCRPQALLGHSVGEYVAACLAGVLTLEEALRLVAVRGRLMSGLAPGAMLSLPLGEEEAAALVSPGLAPGLAVAAVNGPARTVVAGAVDEVEELERRLAGRGIEGRRLRTSHAFHTPRVEPVLDAFAAEVRRLSPRPPRIPWLSNVTGTWIGPAEAADPLYWVRHLRAPVRFGDGIAALYGRPEGVLLEVGPGQTLLALAELDPRRDPRQPALASLGVRDGTPEPEALLRALGRLWMAGVEVDWEAFGGGGRRRVRLPTYPFERWRHWAEPAKGKREPAGVPAAPLDAIESQLLEMLGQLQGIGEARR